MAIGGETIGRAYIRVLADGAGFDDDLRRQMRDNEPQMRQMGEDSGRAYTEGFRRELRKEGRQDTSGRRLRADLARGAGKYDAVGELFGDHLLDGLRESLEGRFGDIGTRIFHNLKEQLDRGEIDFHGLQRSLRNIRPQVAKATDDIVADQKQRFQDLGRAIEDYGSTLLKTRNARRGLLTDLQTLGAQLPRNVTDTDNFRRRMAELGNILTPTGNRLARMRDQFVKSGETIGKFFGRGSRNNFLNFFGGFVSLAPRFIGGLTGATRALAGMGQQLMAAFRAGDTFREGIGNVVSGLGSLATAGLPGLIAAAVAVAAAIQVVVTALPALGAAVSLVLGLVLALAGSLGFALVGALGAVAGALVPFAAALGVGALAMAGLGKKNQGLKDLKKTFDDLKKTAAKGVFGKDGAGLKNLDPILKSLKPLIEGVSGAIGGLLEDLGKAAKSKGFQDMMKGISDMLPGLVTQLGGIGGKLGVGLGQAFVAAEPLIKSFLGFVDQLATKFVKFGEGGKKSGLAKFFDDAKTSMDIIFPMIGDIIGLVGDLMGAGKESGDNVFKGIADQVQKIVKWLSTPEGKKAIEQWFKDAEKLAGALGGIVTKVIEFVDALDTPTSRATLLQILSVVEDIIGALTWAATTADKWNTALIEAGAAVLDWFGALPAMFGGFFATITAEVNIWAQGVQARWDALGAFFSTWVDGIKARWDTVFTTLIQPVITFVQSVIGWFQNLYNVLVGNSIIPDMIMAIVGWFARLPGMIAGVLGDLAGRFVIWLAGVPQKIQQSVGLVVGAFGGLAGKAIARAGNIASAFGKWVAGLPAKAKAMATSVATGFAGLAGKIISRAGSITASFARWVAGLPGKAKSIANSIVSGFSGLAGKIITKAGSITAAFGRWVSSLAGKAKTAANNIVNAFSGVAGKIITKMGSLAAKLAGWGSSAVSKAKGVANNIVSAFSGLASRIVKAIGDIVPKIRMPNIKVPTVVAKVITPKKAAGGIISGAQHVIVGEAGPEAIVPLNRSLARVDPAVRALSAFAQGMSVPGSKDSAPSIGRQIDVGGITINTPTGDPRAVAAEVVNRMTFAAYI
jgi:hypothetical protein